MGVFKKLKDVLFDVEEEDIPVITKEEKVKKEEIIKEENPIKEVKIPKEDLSERELMSSEPTFNFPIDDDEPPRSRVNRDLDFGDDFDDDFEPIVKRKEEPKKERLDYSKFLSEEPKKEEKREFSPSPVISPVYGILDQNYTKDDVIVKTDIGVKGPDLDEVRKKAYGITDKPKDKKKVVKDEEDEFTEPLKTLDEILVDEEETIPSRVKDEVVYREELEDIEPLEKIEDDELPDEPFADDEEVIKEEPVKEEVKEKEEEKEEEKTKKQEKKKLDDTLETDLFNLIDSMYEDKKESEDEE